MVENLKVKSAIVFCFISTLWFLLSLGGFLIFNVLLLIFTFTLPWIRIF